MNNRGPQRATRIILLHGASSSGKSTLAKAVQLELDEPFLHFGSDLLAVGLPARRDADGPFQWWGNVRPRFFDGFQRCIATLATAGNDLIVDHVIEFPAWRAELRGLLAPFDVFLVGVHCSLEELARREQARGDRWIGEGRSHVVDDGIHTFGAYDCEIDTTGREPSEMARELVQRWKRRTVSGPLASTSQHRIVTVFMPLSDEGVAVWRPVDAEALPSGWYRIVSVNKQPEHESWAFPTDAVVVCELRRLSNGECLVVSSERQ